MYYLDIKRHIINKKYLWGYSAMIFIPIIFGYLICTNKINIPFEAFSRGNFVFILLFLALPILSTRCILINSYRSQKFYNFYKNYLTEYNGHFYKIAVEKEAFRINTPHISPNDAAIYPSPKLTNAVYLETDNYLLLFFSVSFWGMFQEVLNPFIFVKPGKEFHARYKNTNIIREFKISQTEQNIVIDFPVNRNEIKKVIIPRLN